MKRILVTGGAGFLGSHLCKLLAADPNNYVIAADNFFTGRACNLAELQGKENFELLEWDITQKRSLEVSQIYNAACPASPPAYQKSPTQTLAVCTVGTANLLNLAAKNNARFLQFSTSEVYGEPLVHPQQESYFGNVNPNGPRSCYDEGKRCAEALCFAYRREFGTNMKIVRIFNSYGPQMDPHDGRVVSNFIMQALKGEDIGIYGTGAQTRSFCYATDTVRGIIAMMNCEEDFAGPVNIGNPVEVTVLSLAEKILAMTGSSSKLRFLPLPADDPSMRRPDITLAKQKLDWQPETPLEVGLEKTIAYFRQFL